MDGLNGKLNTEMKKYALQSEKLLRNIYDVSQQSSTASNVESRVDAVIKELGDRIYSKVDKSVQDLKTSVANKMPSVETVNDFDVFDHSVEYKSANVPDKSVLDELIGLDDDLQESSIHKS